MIRVYESSTITKYYVQYRPVYTGSVKFKDTVLQYCKKAAKDTSSDVKFDFMVDVACGSGQATYMFEPYFKKIMGVDISANQLKEAKQKNAFDNITYELGSAESIPVADKSVDLVISATACHRFDLPKFFKEVSRILKPTGCVALFSYFNPLITPLHVEDEAARVAMGAKANEIMYQFEHIPNDSTTNHHFNSKYADIYAQMPSRDKEHVTEGLVVSQKWNLTELIGYYRSLAAYNEYNKMKREELKHLSDQEFEKHDRALLLRDYIRKEWGIDPAADDESVKMICDFPLFLVMGTGFDC